MNFPDKGTLLDILKGSIATLALFLACITLPLVGFLPGFFAPLPGMFYALKSGKSVGIAIVLITTAVLAMLPLLAKAALFAMLPPIIANPMVAPLYLAQSGLISLALPYSLGKGWGAGRAIALSVVVTFAFLLCMAAYFWLALGIDPHAEILKGISFSTSQSAALYEKSGFKGEDLQTLQQGVKEAGALIARIYPAIVLVGLGAIAGLNLLALKRMAAGLGRMPAIGDFKRFRNPDHLIWFLIVAGFAMLLNNAVVSTAALNLMTVTLSLYFLQGLAIISHFFDRFKVNRFVRAIFYVLLAMQLYLAIAVAVFGIFDLWGNYRTPKKRENL